MVQIRSFSRASERKNGQAMSGAQNPECYALQKVAESDQRDWQGLQNQDGPPDGIKCVQHGCCNQDAGEAGDHHAVIHLRYRQKGGGAAEPFNDQFHVSQNTTTLAELVLVFSQTACCSAAFYPNLIDGDRQAIAG
jgi:hypothetical protein